MVALKEDSSWNVLESNRKMCCAVWHFVTSWWIKILNRELVTFFLIWVAVICRGKSNLLNLYALRCQCQAVGSWLSEPWTQLWWPPSAWPQQLFTLLLPYPCFILSFVLEVCWGRKGHEISEMVSLISASRTIVKVMLFVMYAWYLFLRCCNCSFLQMH